MNSRNRVPIGISDFNNYINNTDDYQLAGTPNSNALRLGLSAANSLEWKNRRIAWVALYKKYIDPSLCTTVVIDEMRLSMKGFKTFSQPLLNIIAASPAATTLDASTFGFTLGRKNPTTPNTPLNFSMMLDVQSKGGGDMAIKCRTSNDSNRPGKPNGADTVQLAIHLGDTPPANADDNTIRELSTKASFIYHAGTANSGKSMHVFARWYNTKHPELAAPWSAMLTVIVA